MSALTPDSPTPPITLPARLDRARALIGDLPEGEAAALRKRAIEHITDLLLLVSMVGERCRNVSSMACATVEAFGAAADQVHREWPHLHKGLWRHEAPGYLKEAAHLIGELLAESDQRVEKEGNANWAISLLGEAAIVYQVCRPRQYLSEKYDTSQLRTAEDLQRQFAALHDDLGPYDAFMVLAHALSEAFGMYASRAAQQQD
ncbi:hypothetical protein ACFV1N_46950 [Streptosporangium canum]|uniref:hypothetical protein n=1 Tax=Streptosporangium canum TaxID=324952 RepID=UPI0036B1FFD8